MQPRRLFLFYNLATAFFMTLAFTLSGVYRVTVAELSAIQLVLVGTVLELSVFLFEIPTGVVADVYSRRTSVIIGVFLIGAGIVVEGLWPQFVPILLAQVLWGVGYTFTSGALQAWISDEIGEEAANHAFLRSVPFGQYGALAGSVTATAIGLASLRLPYLLGGGGLVVFGCFLIFAMAEQGYHPTPRSERSSWSDMWATFRSGLSVVRGRPALMNILWVGLFYGLYSEGIDRLWEANLIERFTFPLFALPVWFGGMRIAARLVSAWASSLAHTRLDMARPHTLAPAMAAITAGIVLSILGFAFSPWLGVSIVLYWVISALRVLMEPLYTAWVNDKLEPGVRATVISMSSQVDAFGQIGGGPLIGTVAQALSLRAGLVSSAILLSPVAAIFARMLRKEQTETDR